MRRFQADIKRAAAAADRKGLAGPGLLAHVAVSKYADHLPLNRLENILSRHGVDITRSTMCDWMRQTADLLMPLYDLMREEVLASRAIHTDDTPVGLREKGRKTNRTSHVWVYLGDEQHPYTAYDFSEGRQQKVVTDFIDGRLNGYMHADATKATTPFTPTVKLERSAVGRICGENLPMQPILTHLPMMQSK